MSRCKIFRSHFFGLFFKWKKIHIILILFSDRNILLSYSVRSFCKKQKFQILFRFFREQNLRIFFRRFFPNSKISRSCSAYFSDSKSFRSYSVGFFSDSNFFRTYSVGVSSDSNFFRTYSVRLFLRFHSIFSFFNKPSFQIIFRSNLFRRMIVNDMDVHGRI